jgi:hypothetical protein
MPGPRWRLTILALTLLSAGCATSAPPTSIGTPAQASPTPSGTIVAVESTAPGATSGDLATRWKATMETHSELNQVNPSALICQTVYEFVFDLLVAPDGTLSGSGDANLKDVPACPKQYGTVIVEKISFGVSGAMTPGGFTLMVTPTGLFEPAGSIDLTGMLVSLSGVATSGAFTVSAQFSDDTHTLADAEFPRTATAGSGVYTTDNALAIVPS